MGRGKNYNPLPSFSLIRTLGFGLFWLKSCWEEYLPMWHLSKGPCDWSLRWHQALGHVAKPRWSSVQLPRSHSNFRTECDLCLWTWELTKMVPWLGIPDTVDSQEHQLSHTQEQQAWAGPARVKGKSWVSNTYPANTNETDTLCKARESSKCERGRGQGKGFVGTNTQILNYSLDFLKF